MGMMPERLLVRVVRPITVALMFGCLAVACIQLLRLLLPRWQGQYVVLLCVLSALEAHYSYGFLRRRSRLLYPVARHRVIEILLLYFAVQAAASIASGELFRLVGAITVDGERIAAFTLVALCWVGATDTARDLYDIGEPAFQSAAYRPPADRLVGRFFAGAAILLVVTGMAQLGTQALTNLAHPPVPGLVLTVLIYFFLGTVMLGQIRYAALWHRWERSGAVVSPDLGGRWLRYSAAFLALMAFCAFLLPTSYTVGLLDVLRYLLQAAAAVIELAMFLLFWPIGWLMTHLGLHPGHAPPPHPLPLRHAPPAPHSGQGTDLLAIIRSAIFWLVVFGVGGFLIRGYVGSRAQARPGPRLLQIVARLLRTFWYAIRQRARRYVGAVLQRVPRRQDALLRASNAGARRRRLPLSHMSDRERVLSYYFSALRRAARQELGRREQETPSEYEKTLAPRLPAASVEVRSLTEAFVEARYSGRDVPSARAAEVRGYWQRVRAALQAAHRKPPGTHPGDSTSGQ